MGLSAESRAYLSMVIAAAGFSTAKWFNSPGPQKRLYKYYILVFVIAQVLGARAGALVADKPQNLVQ